MHVVSTNGFYRLAIERKEYGLVVQMQDSVGRSISAVFEDGSLAALASEPDDDFFPDPDDMPCWNCGEVDRGIHSCIANGASMGLHEAILTKRGMP